jgi:uncharacterized protein YdaU (DUF1376 family)
MHYYQFNIGDYKAATAHLTNEEDLAYRRLLDMYYDSESKIPLDTQWVARRIRVEENIIISVLNDMFDRHENGWFHMRCQEVIEIYQAMAEKNRANGRKGGRKKNPMGSQMDTDSHPIAKATINQELRTNNQNTAIKVATPEGVSDSVWQDFQKLRKSKKAAITATAMLGIKREADKARVSLQQALETCCERGWVGFKAEWLEQKSFAAPLTVPSRQGVDPALAKAIADQLAGKPPSAEIREKLAAIRRTA